MIGKLILLVGPIASGKSTYCRQAAQGGAIIVNDDAIVTALHGGHYQLYSEELKPLYKSVENEVVQMGLVLGRTVVVDRPNYSRAMRCRYIGLARSLNASVEVVLFDRQSSEIHAARRAKDDGRGGDYEYWLKVAKTHESLYEPPELEEGLDSIIHWTFPDSGIFSGSNSP